MPGLVWRPRALRDVDRLMQFLKTKNPAAARRAAQQIVASADSLRDDPRLGKPMADETGRRELSAAFSRRGYILRYMLDGDDAVILRVWHSLEERND